VWTTIASGSFILARARAIVYGKNEKSREMKRYTYLIALMLVVLTSNTCKEEFTDEELTLSLEPYTGNELRLDGYYYEERNDADKDIQIYIFYNNGLIYNNGFLKDDFIGHEQEILTNPIYYDDKHDWGIFQINRHLIKYETWTSTSAPGWPTIIFEGEILNDTTFVITKSHNPETDYYHSGYAVYHFRQLDFKPDSTNPFVP